jgi:two-component system sensor histidine kinase UhpB
VSAIHADLPTRRIVLVEDSPDDAELIGFALRNAPFNFFVERVETLEEFVAKLALDTPDVILCDYHLPRFSMREALRIVREERGLDIPFIVVSRLIGEDAAVEAMQNGADDYLLKGRLGRLPASIEATLERYRSRRQMERADEALARSSLLSRSLLNSLAMRIAVVDRVGKIVAVNAAWERFHGEAQDAVAGHLAVGANYIDHLRAIEAQYGAAILPISAGVEAVIERREARFAMEYQVPMRSGTRWELIRAEPLEDSEHGAVISIENVTPRMLANLALHDANARLQRLSQRIIDVQEEERRAIALELHDDVGQSLAALKMMLHKIAGTAPGGENAAVAHGLAITEDALEKLRRLAYSLRPPQLDQFGLEGALRWLADQQSKATGIAIECRFAGLDRRPHGTVEGACYRIAQEALNNASRHANATQVVIDVKLHDRLIRIAIRDDGAGFDADDAHARAARSGRLGLLGMAERAELAGGWLKVKSVKGSGTTVSATFPFEGAARAA